MEKRTRKSQTYYMRGRTIKYITMWAQLWNCTLQDALVTMEKYSYILIQIMFSWIEFGLCNKDLFTKYLVHHGNWYLARIGIEGKCHLGRYLGNWKLTAIFGILFFFCLCKIIVLTPISVWNTEFYPFKRSLSSVSTNMVGATALVGLQCTVCKEGQNLHHALQNWEFLQRS